MSPTCSTSLPQLTDSDALHWPASPSREAAADLPPQRERQQTLASQSGLQNGALLIECVLGRGGFGITYRARDARRGRAVAIKEFFPTGCVRRENQVQPPPATTPEAFAAARANFLEEARVLSGLRHPNIVRVQSCFEENGTAYMVMEHLHGETLLQRIERDGPLPADEAIAIVEKIGEAVDAVHRLGLLHLDIKPENVFICAPTETDTRAESEGQPEQGKSADAAMANSPAAKPGRFVLMDFDLLQKIETGEAFQTRPLSHTTHCGTPGYAPPEQYSQSAHFSTATDIYALGATLHHLLTGQAPPAATERALSSLPLPVSSTLWPDARRAIEAAMQIRAEQRPQSVREFLDALRPLLGNDAPSAARNSIPPLALNGAAGGTAPTAPGKTAPAPSPSSQPAGNSSLLVRVCAANPQWPPLCACCCAPGDTHWPLAAPRDCRVPYCAACLRHARCARSAGDGARRGMIVGVVMAAAGFLFAQQLAGLLLASLGVIIHFAAMIYWVLKSAVAEGFVAADCCDAKAAVSYAGVSGNAHRWNFKNRRYAEEFRRANAAHVV